MPLIDIPLRTQILVSTVGLQMALPLVLLALLAMARPADRLGWLAASLFVGSYMLALGVIGQFGVPLPWFTGYLYGALALAAAVRAWRRCRFHGWRPPGFIRGLQLGAALLATSALLALSAHAFSGYRAPAAETVNLRFPLKGGLYYVSGAGNSLLINHHLVTLDDSFRRDYRGQSYGIDIAGLNSLGIAAPGILPDDPADYAIFGEPVHAPCAGHVVHRRDGLPDMPPPERDLGRGLGNHVSLHCRGVVVVLAHLRSGSVRVRDGQQVTTGARLARVGNSGETTAPHLHIHAQSDWTTDAPLRAEPVVIRFDGRYPVRNSLFRR